MGTVRIDTPDAERIVVVKCPWKNYVAAALPHTQNVRRWVVNQLGGIVSIGVRPDKLRWVGYEQATIGRPIEKLDVFSAGT
jgi:hypothetical protein